MPSNFAEFNKQVWKFNEEWTAIRLIGALRSAYEFWIPITTKNGTQTVVPKICLDWDSVRHVQRTETCPYCQAGLQGRTVYFSNAIIRPLQQADPAHPERSVHVIKFPPRFYQLLCGMNTLNRKRMKSGEYKYYDAADPMFGFDIEVKANPDTPYSYYDAQLDMRVRLTPEELAYPLVSLDIQRESLSEARHAWHKLRGLYVRKPGV